ncbi:hypothetical protein [Maribacter litopenaei]|uniref:hypothetical protein n=1 Tax=Maribacter litopenaei TaxID=2976127 RepID=UPI0030842994
MEEPLSFYQEEIVLYQEQLTKVKSQLLTSSMIRLTVFLLAACGVYVFYENTRIVLGLVVVVFAIFLFLVSRHTDLQYKRDKLKKLISINETEIQVLKRDFKDLPDGSAFKDDTHFYSQDIDLFGLGSFYQYLNRTSLWEGSQMLASFLKGNETQNIGDKQAALKELSRIPKWRQDFSATASLAKTEITSKKVLQWIKNYTPFIPRFMRVLPFLFTGLSILTFTFFLLDYLAATVLFYWLLLGLIITGTYTKKLTKLVSGTGKIQSLFEQYDQLLEGIETRNFKSELLKDKQLEIISQGRKTSVVLKEFSKLLADLDQNNNLLYLIFGNGLFLRGLHTAFKIEKWISLHGEFVEKWFNCIAFFDSYNSLGNFVFNHPDYTFPVLNENEVCIRSKQAGHPLLTLKRVC